jgi:RNA polymerase sigma-B factor
MDSTEEADESAEDEAALFEAYQSSHSAELQEKLVVRYSRLVVSLVRKFRGRAEWEDLVQVGYVGLLKAISAYRPGSGNRFSTYATHCVLGELRHYLRDRTDTVRRPRWLQAVSRKVGLFVESYLHEHERLPTVTEISEATNIARDGVVEVLKAGSILSLEQMQGEGGGVQVGRIRSLREESFVLTLEDQIWLDSALERLLEVERQIVRMFFYRDLNQSQIAGETGLSPKRVSRIMRRALSRLQGVMRLGGKGEGNG